jgi:2-dehydropantoate 2-reductase
VYDSISAGRGASTFATKWTLNTFWIRPQKSLDPAHLYNTTRRRSIHTFPLASSVPRRIYILGSGNIGKLVAHSIAGIFNPPEITLLLHSLPTLRAWLDEGRAIKIITHGVADTRTQFSVEAYDPEVRRSEEGNETMVDGELSEQYTSREDYIPPAGNSDYDRLDNYHQLRREVGLERDSEETIYNLIVSTKAVNTIAALGPLRHRLTRSSTILFLQNGMGVVEEVCEKLFPDAETRPTLMMGIISHGVYSQSSFTAVHAGFGTTAIGILPRYPRHIRKILGKEDDAWSPSARYMLRTLTRTPVLAAVGFSQIDLQLQQLEKLAINAVINPLTVLLNCRNGDLLFNFATTRTIRLLLAEISLVIRNLPELEGVPNIDTRFSPNRLETIVVGVASKTSSNISSMLQDVRRGKETEVEYINGYIVRRGEELGIKCVMNYMLVQLVKARQMLLSTRAQEYVPLEKERQGGILPPVNS